MRASAAEPGSGPESREAESEQTCALFRRASVGVVPNLPFAVPEARPPFGFPRPFAPSARDGGGLFLSEDARVFPIRPPFGVMPAPPGFRGSLPARAVVASIRARASSVAAMARGAPSGVFPRRFASSEHFQLENAPEVERSEILLFSAYP